MLRRSNQILVAVQATLFVLLITNAPLQSFAQASETPQKVADGDPGDRASLNVDAERPLQRDWEIPVKVAGLEQMHLIGLGYSEHFLPGTKVGGSECRSIRCY